MTMDRRDLIKAVSGASALMAGLAGAAKVTSAADAPASMAPLIAAGLDPLTVYRKMFATTDSNSGTYWCFAGPLPVEIEGVGPVYFVQEETFRAQRTGDLGKNAFYIDWREAGVFRDCETGEVPTTTFNPATGASGKLGHLQHEPARFTITKNKEGGLNIALDTKSNIVQGIAISGDVKGDQVILTHTEYKTGLAPNARLQSATLKIYSSLAELKGKSPSVAAQGFYAVHIVETGKVFVSGLMQKAAPDVRINPIAWDRVKAAIPGFFDGDRVATKW